MTVGPSAYWYLTRASGAVALILLTRERRHRHRRDRPVARRRRPRFVGRRHPPHRLAAGGRVPRRPHRHRGPGQLRADLAARRRDPVRRLLPAAVARPRGRRVRSAAGGGDHQPASATGWAIAPGAACTGWPMRRGRWPCMHGFGTGSDVHQGWLRRSTSPASLAVLAAVVGRVDDRLAREPPRCASGPWRWPPPSPAAWPCGSRAGRWARAGRAARAPRRRCSAHAVTSARGRWTCMSLPRVLLGASAAHDGLRPPTSGSTASFRRTHVARAAQAPRHCWPSSSESGLRGRGGGALSAGGQARGGPARQGHARGGRQRQRGRADERQGPDAARGAAASGPGRRLLPGRRCWVPGTS